MTERALDAHGPEIAAFIEEAGHSHNGVELQERHRRGRVVEIDLARFQLLHQGRRQRIHVHLQAHGQPDSRAERNPDLREDCHGCPSWWEEFPTWEPTGRRTCCKLSRLLTVTRLVFRSDCT